MRVIVCGGRNYRDQGAVFEALDRLHAKRGIALVIHGDARGADRLAEAWAKKRAVQSKPYPADWDNLSHPQAVIRYHPNGKPYNANAGPIRNQLMLDEAEPDGVVAFPGGSGTADMVDRAKRAGLLVWEPYR